MKKTILKFIKQDTVLVVAAVLAVVSAFIVKPSAAYMNYIDFRVLGILLSLMIIMAGFQENGFFDRIGQALLKKMRNTRQLCLVLVLLCFFFAMLITNDVALITFVPFTMMLLKACGKEQMLIPVIVTQTIAANLGSMLTPIGNPQNLYLYNLGGFSLIEFVTVMMPYSLISFVAIVLWTCIICRHNEKISIEKTIPETQIKSNDRKMMFRIITYMVLFVLSILVVVRMIPYYIVLVLVVLVTLILDRQVLKKVDYSLLFTFCFFFIFTGNIGQMEAAKLWLQGAVEGRTLIMGTVVSQVISNVPATLLLSGFTSDYEGLLIGVNIGGLGTLIASMASLISYKIYVHAYDQKKGQYFLHFTGCNVVFLILLLAGAQILR